ncbi:MAG TPA: hypothetical protein EYP65_06480 [Armatimonadetes bacterium]|nr:hypothetical protein [Armatimonadota bacterium]
MKRVVTATIGALAVALSAVASAQDVWVGGNLKLQYWAPSEGAADFGWGPEANINLTAEVEPTLTLYWAHSPYFGRVSEFWAKLETEEGLVFKAGRMFAPFGPAPLRAIDRTVAGTDVFQYTFGEGVGLEVERRGLKLSAAILSGAPGTWIEWPRKVDPTKDDKKRLFVRLEREAGPFKIGLNGFSSRLWSKGEWRHYGGVGADVEWPLSERTMLCGLLLSGRLGGESANALYLCASHELTRDATLLLSYARFVTDLAGAQEGEFLKVGLKRNISENASLELRYESHDTDPEDIPDRFVAEVEVRF